MIVFHSAVKQSIRPFVFVPDQKPNIVCVFCRGECFGHLLDGLATDHHKSSRQMLEFRQIIVNLQSIAQIIQVVAHQFLLNNVRVGHIVL